MRTISLSYFFILCITCFYTSCASIKPYYSSTAHQSEGTPDTSSIDYTLFLAGGISLHNPSPVLDAIEKISGSKNSGLLLLGDVLSIDDLSLDPEGDHSLEQKEMNEIRRLDSHFKDLYLIPGQKEWTTRRDVSPVAINSLDHLVKDIKNKGRFIQPRKGCGSPETFRISTHAIVVMVDSEWAIESESRSGEKLPGCEIGNVLELKLAIKDAISSHPTDQIIIATHHPVFANGSTANNYPLSSHLLPVPVLGTLITGIKTLVSSDQHFGHPAYEAYRAAVIGAVDGCTHCIVVSGHEKNMQYYQHDGQHYFVEGSGDKIGYARRGEKSDFSFMSRGFLKADALHDGSLNISFIALDKNNIAHTVWQSSFPVIIKNSEPSLLNKNPIVPRSDSILIAASARYEKKKFLRGDGYRAAWSKKVLLPVVWLDQVHGGLHALQLGGGHQTRSLRLENDKGQQYVLRSIDKQVRIVLPPALRGTFAETLVQEGIAASHPYGCLVVPRLAQAAGVFYSNPSIVYVPQQPALGIYNDDIGNGVYIFEERPGGNTSGFSNFGNTEETFNTLDVIDLVNQSQKYEVDQKSVLRARLFDTWLGDWDRHDDQVRWASFKENNRTVFRPIPRDRDQVFFNNDGFLDHLSGRPYFNPALRRFQAKIDYLPGLVWAGKFFDRSFMHELTQQDFIDMAKELQHNLTDQVIDEAFKNWPAAIDSLNGPRIRSYLRTRRDHLVEDALKYYALLSKTVAIPGTDDKDIFTITATDAHHVDITVERKSENSLHLFYHRIFDDAITGEIQLFGLEKDDSFTFNGNEKSSIHIRVIGGTGEDEIINHTSDHIKAYDAPEGLKYEGGKVSLFLNDKPFNNTYDRTDYKLNKFFHFPAPTFYTDEGLGLTYNIWWTRFGFRSDPFKSKHSVSVSYFFNTEAFIGKYSGDWTHVIGDVDLGLDAFVTGPTFTQYYYGLGNTYVDYGQNHEYHIVKGSQINLSPALKYRFGFGNTLSIKSSYQFLDLENGDDEPRFVFSPESHLTQKDFGHRNYLGLTVSYKYERFDNKLFPSRGGDFEISIGGQTAISGKSYTHSLASVQAALYIPLDVSARIVIATHVQADKIFGDYEFFHALTLGGSQKLRGFKTDRFAGDVRMFQNTDLRITLFKAGGMFPFTLGCLGSVDYGRIWYKDDLADSDKWHVGYGGGLFIVPLGLAAFKITYMSGQEDNQVTIGGSLKF